MVAQRLVFPPHTFMVLGSNLSLGYKNIGNTKFRRNCEWICLCDVLQWTGIPSNGLSLMYIQCFWDKLQTVTLNGIKVTVNEWMNVEFWNLVNS